MRVESLPHFLPGLFTSRAFAVVLVALLAVLFVLAFDDDGSLTAGGVVNLASNLQPHPFRWTALVPAFA